MTVAHALAGCGLFVLGTVAGWCLVQIGKIWKTLDKEAHEW